MFKSLAFAGLLLALLPNQVSAQAPTQAQRDAIRAACRSDFMANCSGVQPGGKEAFECLLRNDAKLSPSCQAAVNAATPKPAEAAEPAAPATAVPAQSETAPPAAKVERAPPGIQVAPAEAQNDALKTVQQACTLNDFVAHCSWIAPSNPEILLCLKGNAADLSPNCQAAVRALPAAPPPAAATPAEPPRQAAPAKKPTEPKPAEPARASTPPAPAAPATSAAAPAAPTAQQKAAIRAACRSDSCPAAQACSPAAPKRCNASKATRRSSRPRAAAPWPRSAVAAPARRRPHPEHRLLLRRQRSRPSDRCRCCARARRWRSCKFAAPKCARSAPASRSAAAVSSVASPQTHRACRRTATAR
jgi:hypothetical protein